MLVGSEFKKIDYVALEVIRKKATKASDIDCGLYMGVCCRKDTKNVEHNVLTVLTSKNSLRLYNLSEYNVVTIDVVADETRYMTVFTNELLDQVEAGLLLKEITTVLDKDNRLYTNDVHKELINVETYREWPAIVLEGRDLTSKSGTSNTGTTTATENPVYSHTPYVPPVEKVPEVTVIKRKGKLPSIDVLTNMRDKVILLGLGQFTFKLFVPDCDKEKPKDIKQTEHVVGARHVAGYMGGFH